MNSSAEINTEYTQMMDLIYKLCNHLIGEPVTEKNKWVVDAEAITAKLFNHLGTIFYLRKGTLIQLPNLQPSNYFDHASISIIVRAVFETYLTFYYLFCDCKIDSDEQKLRHLSWKLRGLLDRQSFRVTLDEHKQKLEKEKLQIAQLQTEIKKIPLFKQKVKKIQKALMKGDWRGNYSWANLSKFCGFNEKVFRDTYKYLCSYSHSGSLSALQIRDAVNIKDQFELTKTSMHYGLIIMSHFVVNYTNLFPKAKKIFENETQFHLLSQKWLITWNEKEFLNP